MVKQQCKNDCDVDLEVFRMDEMRII